MLGSDPDAEEVMMDGCDMELASEEAGPDDIAALWLMVVVAGVTAASARVDEDGMELEAAVEMAV